MLDLVNRVRPSQLIERVSLAYPGLLLAIIVALAAQFLGSHYGAPVMLFALLLGMPLNFLAEDSRCTPGIAFTARHILRAGVALLGVRVSTADFQLLGATGIVTILGLLGGTIILGVALARLMREDWRFGVLSGGAVAICGASAALAIAAALPGGKRLEKETLFAIVAVTGLSTVAMILYPIVLGFLGLADIAAGFVIGASFHDVAQVVGAGLRSGQNQSGTLRNFLGLSRRIGPGRTACPARRAPPIT